MITVSIADALSWKYFKPGDKISTKRLADGSFVITRWELQSGIPQPNDAQIIALLAEHSAYLESESHDRKNKKKALLQKLGLNKQEVVLLKDIILNGIED